MMNGTIETIYHGSVKEVLGPIKIAATDAVIFDYTDSFSVFDWGRMPDTLKKKGEALALIAASVFEKIERPITWKEFSKSDEALKLRKANRFGSDFIEVGEKLQAEGLRTHYLGLLPKAPTSDKDVNLKSFDTLEDNSKWLAVRRVHAVKPDAVSILGTSVPDYLKTRQSPFPRLIPLEVVFRFSCPAGSSLTDRVAGDPNYLAARGFFDIKFPASSAWDFPILELFTKLETTDRPISFTEALSISGIKGRCLQDMLFKTAWLASYLRSVFMRHNLELADGKFEWGVDENGEVFLVDSIGPDEFRVIGDGVQLSKEFLRHFYRKSFWYSLVKEAKLQASKQGISEWKRLVSQTPPVLNEYYKEVSTQLYLSLANTITGKNCFSDAWNIDQVIAAVREICTTEDGI